MGLVLVSFVTSIMFDTYVTQHRQIIRAMRTQTLKVLFASFACLCSTKTGQLSLQQWSLVYKGVRRDYRCQP